MRVEIWSDVVCPWCAIGKAHLDSALSRFEHAEEVEIVWRSFELDAAAPEVRHGAYSQLLAAKYGVAVSDAEEMVERMTRTAAASGLEFHLDRCRPGNSFDAHRLVHLARGHGRQTQVKERFLRAYLCEGEAIGEAPVLERLAVEAGLPDAEVRRVLTSRAYADAVRADEDRAARLGITGVPLFLIDGKFAISGAQPVPVMAEALRRAWAERTPVTVVGEGQACGPDGCVVDTPDRRATTARG